MKKTFLRAFSWAVGSLLVASIVWAAYGWRTDNYGNIKSARSTVLLSPGQTSNCKLSYAADTLSVVGTDGNALSKSNPCVIGMPNGAAASVETPVSTTFGAASDTDGNLFGIADADWAAAMPMYLYYCDGNGADYFGFTRQPNRIETGNAATDICQEADTDCDAQTDMLLMTTGLTLASEVDRACIAVGSFEASYATAGGAWTVGALVAGRDGFGLFQEGQSFTFPPGQNGASAGSRLSEAGAATSLAFSNEGSVYSIDRQGMVRSMYNTGTRSAGDASATNLYIHLPYVSVNIPDIYGATWKCRTNINGVFSEDEGLVQAGQAYMMLYSPANAVRTVAAFANAVDYIQRLTVSYKAF